MTSTHLNKEDKVLERGVEVRLLLQLDNRVKVLVVDVSVNTEESLQNGLGHRHEVLWEGDTYKEVTQKNYLKMTLLRFFFSFFTFPYM